MFWCFKLSYGTVMKLNECRNKITFRNNSLCEWKSTLRLLCLSVVFFFFQEIWFVNGCVKEMWERGGRLAFINLRPASSYTPPTPHCVLPARPLSTSSHSFRPGPGGEEAAAPAGIWHHNYIGSWIVCCLLELERLQGCSHVQWMWSLSDTVCKVR